MALGPNGNHEGIDQATDKLVEDLRLYINTHKIKGEIAIWVAGFSRAAGVCNLFAGRLCDDLPLPRQVRFDKKRLFAYSFASPNVTDLPIKDEGIHNVIFENDLIPRIPFPTFGLSRHGEDHIIRADPGELASLLSSLGLDDIPSFKMMKLDLAHILDAKKRFKIDVDNPLGQGEFVSIFFDAISTLFTREDYFYGLEGGLVRLGSLVDSSLPNPYGKLGAFMSAFFSTLLEEKGKQIFFNAFGLNIDWSSYIPDIAERAGEEVGLEENDISEISASMTFLFRKMSPLFPYTTLFRSLLPYLPTIANKGNGRSLVFAHEVVVYYALINRD